jgi:leucyl-tRNA synthetase
MDEYYRPEEIEPLVQKSWEEAKVFQAKEDPAREKFYCLSMFPYPSGALHMGHVRNYTIGDVISRYQRMRGRNVLQPMGWDAFGLPAENAAIKHHVPPARWTYANIEHMRGQLERLGFAYDWSRELATCRPEYYRWEQLLFTRLFEKGLVYRKNSVVNWDPVDQTVLANEQVIDGRGWRSGAIVERREIPQWFLKITAYAQELLDELDRLPGWPESVKTMQRNWIGRSEGLEIQFCVEGEKEPLTIYTTRPDTLMGVTYMAVAAEHPLAQKAAVGNPRLAAFLKECSQTAVAEATMETMEKRGMPLGIFAIHPVTGERVPVWAANFVLMGYGTGAVMAVPGHDQRDWEFAGDYGLPIKQVIRPSDGSSLDLTKGAFTEHGILVNSGDYDGMTFEQSFNALAERFERAGIGQRRVNFRLRDWGVSRQRYWGCPIPIIYCPKCDAVPVPEDQLPVVLPEEVNFTGVQSPIKADPDWRKCTCPNCGGPAERETDTFDTFMESSWYHARYCCPDNGQVMLDERANYWLPVDQYIGGIEHAILHLLYARFYHKLLRDVGMVRCDEPFANLLTQGMVIAETYYREDAMGHKTWFNPADVEVDRDPKGRIIGARSGKDGQPVEIGGIEKMSKSKNNGVDPQTLIDKYGADTVRLFTMFASPPEQSLEWSDAGAQGAYRFLRRLWTFSRNACDGRGEVTSPLLSEAKREIHLTLKQANHDFARHQFNTVVSAAMKILNVLESDKVRNVQDHAHQTAIVREGLSILLRLLAPITPHLSDYLWRELKFGENILETTWPEPDEQALQQDEIELVLQINGKLRGNIRVPADAGREVIEALALANPAAEKHMEGKAAKKVVVVPGRLVNIVTG